MPNGPPPLQFFFSRSGFAEELVRDAEASERTRLVGPSEMF